MIELEMIHNIFDILIILLLPIMTVIVFSTSDRIGKSEFKKLTIPLFAGFAIIHVSYAIRAANHLLFELEILRFLDIFILMVAVFVLLIFVIKAYKFTEEFGFNISETTKKLEEWVKNF